MAPVVIVTEALAIQLRLFSNNSSILIHQL